MAITSIRTEFDGHSGAKLAARLDVPAGPVRAYALFAHCFTCSKDILAAKRVAAALAQVGIAVLRFDFTGLGSSHGEFASTNFSSNTQDLLIAVDYLRRHHQAPALMIGHSLGGAAVLAVAGRVPEVKAVATIGAPADTEHVLHNFESSLEAITRDGVADVVLGGRNFKIEKQFIDDARGVKLEVAIAGLRKPLMVLHSPIDTTVGVENASRIFVTAKHPKSFVSLDGADHLLSKAADAEFAASVIAGWAGRYIAEAAEDVASVDGVRVAETGEGKFQNLSTAGKHRLLADEPKSVGGLDSGPSPYDFLSIALGACTSMTLRMYAEHKGLTLGRVSVDVTHAKVHADDCAECEGRDGRIDRFERVIAVEGGVAPELEAKLVEIAGKCPVHRTLEASSVVATRVVTA